jgi:PTS system mannose-specific IID component
MPRLTAADLMRVALRTPLLQATWNYERQQGLGWAWCMKPVLDRLYRDPAVRRDRLAEHTDYFNTQPTLASVALGVVAGLEEQRVDGGTADADTVRRVKGVLGSALAALGDRLFWFTLRPFSAMLGVLCALTLGAVGALVMWTTYNGFHLVFRIRGVDWGYRQGPGVLGPGLRHRLEWLVRRLNVLGAALIGMVVAVLLAPGGEPRSVTFQAALVGGLVLGLFAALRARPSPTEWALGIGALTLAAVWFR